MTSRDAAPEQPTQAASLSALMPLKITGRHYGENLARVDLLFSSLRHFAAPGLLDELVVVVRADEEEAISRRLAHWPDLPLRIAIEEDYFPAFRRFTRPWQMRPWQRQQIIKLNAPAIASSPFVLVLDPDVLAVKALSREVLLPGGRAILEPESRDVHRQWWLDSAALLSVEPGLDRPGMNVTPAILSNEILTQVQRRLETVGGRPWMEVLLTSYCEWTEYTLYLLAAEAFGLVEQCHVRADESVGHLQVAPEISIWDAAAASPAAVDRLFTTEDPGLFAVVQSNAGLTATDVAAAVSAHLAIRTVPTDQAAVSRRSTKVRERFNTASRLIAQRIYRWRQQTSLRQSQRT